MRKRALSLLSLSTVALVGLYAAPRPTTQDPDPYEQLERLKLERQRGSTGAPSTGAASGLEATPSTARPAPTQSPAPPVATGSWGKTRAATRVLANHDSASPVVRSLEAGIYLRLFEEVAGYYRAEVPGGFPAWIHESLVAPTDREGQLMVTATRVYVRTQPSRTAIPVEPDRFEPGDKVLVQGRQGEFFQVITPTRIQAWVPASDVELLADSEQNETQWRLQALTYAQARVNDMRGFAERAEQANRLEEFRREYRALHERVAREADKGADADLDPLYAAYGELRSRNSHEDLVPEYKRGIDLLDKTKILVDAERRKRELEAEMEKARVASAKEIEAERKVVEASYAKPGPDAGIKREYQEFGWLRKRGGLLDEPVYFELERGGQRSVYVECHSGRYDLTDYVDREIALAGDKTETVRGPVFNVRRIRILTNPR